MSHDDTGPSQENVVCFLCVMIITSTNEVMFSPLSVGWFVYLFATFGADRDQGEESGFSFLHLKVVRWHFF